MFDQAVDRFGTIDILLNSVDASGHEVADL